MSRFSLMSYTKNLSVTDGACLLPKNIMKKYCKIIFVKEKQGVPTKTTVRQYDK